jgi:hypothetical protein
LILILFLERSRFFLSPVATAKYRVDRVINGLSSKKGAKMFRLSLVALTMFLISAQGWGAIMDVVYTGQAGYPDWTGQVDTIADTLTINTWVTNNTGQTFMTPNVLPWTWNAAYSGTGLPYDVPNDFDGSDMVGWGFLSPDRNDVPGLWDAVSTSTAFCGWGLGHIPPGNYLDSGSNSVRYIPVGFGSASSAWSASVTVTPVLVPEPSSLAFLGIGALGIAGRRRKRTA